jgi:histidinol-phosphate transaminase
MTYHIPEQLKKLTAYQTVSDQYRIRLDANESFLSLPQEVLDQIAESVKRIPFNRYPDPNCTTLCEAFADYYGIKPECTVAGNGSDELINLLLETFLSDGDTVLVTDPDFSMYTVYANLLKLRVVTYRKTSDYRLDEAELLRCAERENAKLIIFSNPCNPTGQVLGREAVRRLIEGTSALVVLDEAYMDFADESLLEEVEQYSNLIILRTLSKAFACAAARLGFAVGRKELIDIIRAVKSPYNVNSFSQKIGEILFSNPSFIRSALEKVRMGRDFLYEKLSEIKSVKGASFSAMPTSTNFVYIETEKAEEINASLREQGICVRQFPGRLRISAGSRLEILELIDILKTL